MGNDVHSLKGQGEDNLPPNLKLTCTTRVFSVLVVLKKNMVRVKYRYFLCEVIADDYLNPKQLKLTFSQFSILQSIENAIRLMYGDFGFGVTHSGLCIKMYNSYTRIFLLRGKRQHHTIIAGSLPFVQQIGDKQISIKVLHIGGTIRTCLNFLRKYDHEQLMMLISRCKTEEEKESIKKEIKTTYKTLGVEENIDSE